MESWTDRVKGKKHWYIILFFLILVFIHVVSPGFFPGKYRNMFLCIYARTVLLDNYDVAGRLGVHQQVLLTFEGELIKAGFSDAQALTVKKIMALAVMEDHSAADFMSFFRERPAMRAGGQSGFTDEELKGLLEEVMAKLVWKKEDRAAASGR